MSSIHVSRDVSFLEVGHRSIRIPTSESETVLTGHHRDEDDKERLKRMVRSNNFTQQTNALDVDRHM